MRLDQSEALVGWLVRDRTWIKSAESAVTVRRPVDAAVRLAVVDTACTGATASAGGHHAATSESWRFATLVVTLCATTQCYMCFAATLCISFLLSLVSLVQSVWDQ